MGRDLAPRSGSLRAEYDRDVDRALARDFPNETLTEAAIAHLPPPVQQYLRTTGVLGRPRVHNFRARMRGRIRSSRHAWKPVDTLTARASFTNAGHTIHAELVFNEAGELTNFWSDDRYQMAPDGKSVKRVRWSAPLGRYRSAGRAGGAGGAGLV
jgi:hypothetical protein